MSEPFSPTETGLSHPIRNLAVRLLDDGRVAIMAGERAAIILNEDGEVTIIGTSLNLVSGELKIDGHHVDKELIADRSQRTWTLGNTGSAVRRSLLEKED